MGLVKSKKVLVCSRTRIPVNVHVRGVPLHPRMCVGGRNGRNGGGRSASLFVGVCLCVRVYVRACVHLCLRACV